MGFNSGFKGLTNSVTGSRTSTHGGPLDTSSGRLHQLRILTSLVAELQHTEVP